MLPTNHNADKGRRGSAFSLQYLVLLYHIYNSFLVRNRLQKQHTLCTFYSTVRIYGQTKHVTALSRRILHY